MIDLAIVGGGLVGLATAFRFLGRFSGRRVVLLEKERAPGTHQSGHNSGVLHSGLYYAPGSRKALLCRRGKALLEAFCEERGVPYRRRGKVVVATESEELPRLTELARRGRANGVELEEIGPSRLRELEPHVRGLAALHVPETAVVDFREVARALAQGVAERGGELRTGSRVLALDSTGAGTRLLLEGGEVLEARRAVACGGLQADRLARSSGGAPELRIVPFLGQYHALKRPYATRVRSLVYPVPDPRFPFLGVHLTRNVDGRVACGPNAVPAWAREGYGPRSFDPRDAWETLSWPGSWRLAARYLRHGTAELWRSTSRRSFARAAARLLPELEESWLEPAPAGVRAQALDRSGRLVDDFAFERRGAQLHVLCAPSPAATACLAIADHLIDELGA